MGEASEFLAHWGIKGMRWGVRRDIGPDGRVEKVKAQEAKDRDRVNKDKLKSRKLVDIRVTKDASDASFVRNKARISGLPSLTNHQLQTAITRMNLEQQYSSLKMTENDYSYVGRGKKWAGNFVNDVLKDAAGSWIKRPGSNISGRTTVKARSWIGPQPSVSGVAIRRAIEA